MAEALRRRLGLGLLTAYGVGVMVGAGIYVLVGAVAAQAGLYAPLAFLIAGLVAAPSAISYAELSSRIPEAAGEAAYVEAGLGLHWLAVAVGLGIVLAGMVSAAAVLRGGVGYLLVIFDIPFEAGVIGIGAALTLVALVGVLESLSLAALFTAVEVAGLILVVWAGFTADPVEGWGTLPPLPPLAGLGAAAALAFFAFIGFEDLVNMAEEVKRPERTMPRAIMLALAITTGLYALVSIAAVRAVPVPQLAVSEKPLALVWQAGRGESAVFLSGIAVIAALNGVLAQIVMAARVLFGLGRREPRLAVFYHSHPRFRTPARATLLIGLALIVAALSLPVAQLAGLTSGVLLVVFAVVNLSLIVLKRRRPEAPFRAPDWVPWAGFVASLAALGAALWSGS